jgi:hypothetical protein
MPRLARPWLRIALVATAIGVFWPLSSITTDAQLSGRADVLLGGRMTLSLLLNAGTVWAGLSVLAGWLVRGPLPALAAGPLIGIGALTLHHGVDERAGLMARDRSRATCCGSWPPLSWVCRSGSSARWLAEPMGGGWVARFVVPAGALIEPWAQGWFVVDAHLFGAVVVARVLAGAVLTLGGSVGAVMLLRHRRPASP